MNRRNVFLAAAAAGTATLVFGLGVAVGQQAPAANRGVSVGDATALDLTNEMDSVAGRQLRMRLVTIEPGGAVALHSHKDRPSVAYIVKGTLHEHLADGTVHVHRTGESWTEPGSTTHWAENRSDGQTVVLAVDVFKP